MVLTTLIFIVYINIHMPTRWTQAHVPGSRLVLNDWPAA